MAEKIKLLELDLGTDAVLAKSIELKENIAKAREEIDKLKKAGEGNSEAAIKQEASLKKLNAEYSNNQKVLSALVTTNGKAIPIQEKVNLLLDEETTSRIKAKQSITEMNKLKDELNVNVKDEALLLDQLNKKINENTEFLRKTGSEEDKRILNIGNYKQGVMEAISSTGLYSAELSGLTKVYDTGTKIISPFTDAISSNWKNMKTASAETEGMSLAQKGLTIATNTGTGAMRIFALAVAATGIGAILIVIALLIGYFKTFDPLIDKIEQGFAAFGAVIRVIQQTIVGFISNLKSVGDLFSKIGNIIANPIDSFQSLGKEMANAAKAAADLKEKQQDLADQQAIQSVANKKQEAEISRLITQSKNRALSEEERIALLEKAEKINRENFATNSKLADQEQANALENARIKGALTEQEVANLRRVGLEYAYKLLNAGRITQEEVDMLAKAEDAKIEIYSRSTNEQEKIINRQNALAEKAEAAAQARQQKAEEARKKALDETTNLLKAELDLYLSTQGIKVKSTQEELKIAEEVRDKKLKIAQAEFNASAKNKSDELKLLTDQNNIKNEFLQKQLDTVISSSSRELDAFVQANQSKIDAQKFFSELSLQEEQRRIDAILEQQLRFERIRFEQGIINETEYQDAIKQLRDDYQVQQDETNAQRKEAETERQAIDLENQRAYEDLVFQDNLSIQLERLEQSRLQEVSAAEKNGASVELINKKYLATKLKLQRESEAMQLAATANTLSLVKGLLEENTTAYKAIAIAETFINTYSAIAGQLKAFSKVPIPGYAIAQAIATGAVGFAQVAKIAGIKFQDGGLLQGPSHSNGGIPFTIAGKSGFEAEGGEAIINKKSTAMFAPLLSYLNEMGGGKRFANGGMATTMGITSSLKNTSFNIDYDLLASKIGNNVAEANSMLPAPRLALEDFNTGNGKYTELIQGANH